MNRAKYQLLNMLKIKRMTISKSLTFILLNLNNLYSLEVVNRVSKTQLQVGGNSSQIIRRVYRKIPLGCLLYLVHAPLGGGFMIPCSAGERSID